MQRKRFKPVSGDNYDLVTRTQALIIVLAEDLQPSTGTFGSILWAYAARSLNDSASARIYANATFTNNGDNDRDYQFGHETTTSLGASYQTQSPWGFIAELLYRQTERDKRASSTIPNTGGEWLDIIPAVQYHITDSMALRASAKIPVPKSQRPAAIHDKIRGSIDFFLHLRQLIFYRKCINHGCQSGATSGSGPAQARRSPRTMGEPYCRHFLTSRSSLIRPRVARTVNSYAQHFSRFSLDLRERGN